MTRDEANPYQSPDPNFVGDEVAAVGARGKLVFRLSGAVSAADAAHGMRVAAPRWWVGWLLVGGIGVILFGFGLLQFMFLERSAVYLLVGGGSMVVLAIRGARRHIRETVALHRLGIGTCTPQVLTIDQDRLIVKTAQSETIETWAAYEKFMNSQRVAVLFYPGGIFRIIPRAFFPDEESWQRFLALLAEKVRRG